MSKKLLKEGTVRKFMKLANLSSFSNNFVNEKYDMNDEPLPKLDVDTKGADLSGKTLVPPKKDEVNENLYEGDDAADSVDPADVAQAAFAALADVFEEFGVDVSVDGVGDDMDDDDMEGMDDDDMEDMGDDDMEDMGDDEPPLMDGEPDGEVEGDEGPSELEESLFRLLDQSGIEIVDDRVMKEALVRKVAARVARRLLKESL